MPPPFLVLDGPKFSLQAPSLLRFFRPDFMTQSQASDLGLERHLTAMNRKGIQGIDDQDVLVPAANGSNRFF